MPEFILEVILFVWSVTINWANLVTGGLITAFIVVVQYWMQKSLSWRVYRVLIALFIGVACFLAWREEYRRAERLSVENARLQGGFEVLKGGVEALKGNMDNFSTRLATLERETSKGERPPLKQRALFLSAEILSFVAEKDSELLSLPVWGREPRDEDTRTINAFFRQVMHQYSQRFSARVIAIRDELAQHGVQDSELDKSYQYTNNVMAMRTVGERLGALAERLP